MMEYFEVNQEIHEAILAAARNQTLNLQYRSLATQVRRARYPREHDRRALEAGDRRSTKRFVFLPEGPATARGLAEVLREHLRNKLETVRSWLRSPTADTALKCDMSTGSGGPRRRCRAWTAAENVLGELAVLFVGAHDEQARADLLTDLSSAVRAHSARSAGRTMARPRCHLAAQQASRYRPRRLTGVLAHRQDGHPGLRFEGSAWHRRAPRAGRALAIPGDDGMFV